MQVLIHAGPEIGVASTKAFTTQITVLTMIALRLAKAKGPSLLIFICICKLIPESKRGFGN
jgi:glucosamine--fructose-6-phosphate aminotransferase (isomerizing)